MPGLAPSLRLAVNWVSSSWVREVFSNFSLVSMALIFSEMSLNFEVSAAMADRFFFMSAS